MMPAQSPILPLKTKKFTNLSLKNTLASSSGDTPIYRDRTTVVPSCRALNISFVLYVYETTSDKKKKY